MTRDFHHVLRNYASTHAPVHIYSDNNDYENGDDDWDGYGDGNYVVSILFNE